MNKEFLVESMSHGAYAIATDSESGKKIFVENACPGDVLDLEIYDERKDFSFAHISEVLTESDLREEDPKCKLHKICGSCQWQHVKYDEQLNFKKKNLIDLLKQNQVDLSLVGDLDGNVSITGLDEPWHYRNKVIYPVSSVKSTGRVLAGYYKRKSNELINIKYCPIQYSIFDEIIDRLKELCTEYTISDPLMRHMLLRASHDQSEVLISFIVRGKLLDKKQRAAIRTIFEKIYSEYEQIKVCTLNINDDSTNVILGPETELIVGERDFIYDQIKNVTVKISTSSFFQINNKQFCNILNAFEGHTENIKPHKVLDAYAGLGSISLNLAKDLPETQFYAFEINSSAVTDALENIKENNLTNLNFMEASAEEYFQSHDKEFDLIILNPPRKGCTNKVLDALMRRKELKDILYLSCNPATLARDIKYLEKKSNFRVQSIKAFDMFPHSFHLETLVKLTR
ncbi:MAG: 23S rRNA (uracil(1939)-C(5))-methyltransferase RlmD [Candidatus Caenarcaniphilales bacterium]|nr:23S rRNA (uracil(1939)-C(5))-methyltransferase RlmD [Candidatus Caenarcaniphilales bacterium]